MYIVSKNICKGFEKGRLFSEQIVADFFKVSMDIAQQMIMHWIDEKRAKAYKAKK